MDHYRGDHRGDHRDGVFGSDVGDGDGALSSCISWEESRSVKFP